MPIIRHKYNIQSNFKQCKRKKNMKNIKVKMTSIKSSYALLPEFILIHYLICSKRFRYVITIIITPLSTSKCMCLHDIFQSLFFLIHSTSQQYIKKNRQKTEAIYLEILFTQNVHFENYDFSKLNINFLFLFKYVKIQSSRNKTNSKYSNSSTVCTESRP